MLAYRSVATLRIGVLSGMKISIFAVLLALGFTACKSETVEPNSSNGNKSKSVDKPDRKIFAEEHPPREPDPGGGK